MPRAKGGFKTRRRRKKTMKMAAGYRQGRSRLLRAAKETLRRGLRYAYRDRRVRKREFRKLWVIRIGALAREQGISYSQLMGQLRKAGIPVNRKMLSELAVRSPRSFQAVVEAVRHPASPQA